jgi:hypothetical protein
MGIVPVKRCVLAKSAEPTIPDIERMLVATGTISIPPLRDLADDSSLSALATRPAWECGPSLTIRKQRAIGHERRRP